jgi:hypothetical protein
MRLSVTSMPSQEVIVALYASMREAPNTFVLLSFYKVIRSGALTLCCCITSHSQSRLDT